MNIQEFSEIIDAGQNNARQKLQSIDIVHSY